MEFTIDTGFDGDLAMSREAAQTLDLTSVARRFVRLANGEEIELIEYVATIYWIDSRERRVEVIIMEGNPLLGTNLLMGSLLQVEGEVNGAVIIESLD